MHYTQHLHWNTGSTWTGLSTYFLPVLQCFVPLMQNAYSLLFLMSSCHTSSFPEQCVRIRYCCVTSRGDRGRSVWLLKSSWANTYLASSPPSLQGCRGVPGVFQVTLGRVCSENIACVPGRRGGGCSFTVGCIADSPSVGCSLAVSSLCQSQRLTA